MPLPSWSQLPTSVLGQQRNEQTADSWAEQQRTKLADTWASMQRGWLGDLMRRAQEVSTPRPPEPLSLGQVGSFVSEQWENTKRDIGDIASETVEIAKNPAAYRRENPITPPGLEPLMPLAKKGLEVVSRPFNLIPAVAKDVASDVETGEVFRPGYSPVRGSTLSDTLTGARADSFMEEAAGIGSSLVASSDSGILKAGVPFLFGVGGLAADIATPGPDLGALNKAGKVAEPLAASGVGLGVANRGLLKGKAKAPSVSVSPVVDALNESWGKVPEVKATEPLAAGKGETARRAVVEAVTNRGVYADKLVEGAGTNIESAYNAQWRLDPFKAAETDNQLIKPVVQALRGIPKGLETFQTFLHLRGAREIAESVGRRAEAEVLGRDVKQPWQAGAANAEAGANRLAEARLAGLEPMDELNTQYGKVQEEIARLQGEIDELGASKLALGESSGIIRPPNLRGFSDQELVDIAKQAGVNPYQEDWWDSLDKVYLASLRRERASARWATKTAKKKALAGKAPEAERELRAATKISERLERKMGQHFDLPEQIAKRQEKIDALKAKAADIVQRAEARRAERATAKGAKITAERKFSGGITADQADAELANIQKALGPEAYAAFENAAERVFRFNDETRQMLVDAELLSPERAAEMAADYQHWTPTEILKHLQQQEGRAGGAKGISFSQTDAGIKAYTEAGTEAERLSPLVASLNARTRAWKRVQDNKVFLKAADMIDSTPEYAKAIKRVAPDIETYRANPETMVAPDYVPVNGEGFLSGFRQGEAVKYVVPQDLSRAFELASYSWFPGLRAATHLWASGVTSRAIPFLAFNAFRDLVTYTGRETIRGGGTPAATGRALRELWGAYGQTFQGLLQGEYKGDLARAFRAGVGFGSYTRLEPKSGQRALEAFQRNSVLEVTSTDDVLRLMKGFLKFDYVLAVGERIEMAPRVASMRLAEKRGKGPVASAIAAREVTVDFAQGGWLTKALNDAIPFTNVATQVGASLWRMYKDNPKGAAATIFGLAIPATLAAETWNRSDPQRAKDYADVPQWIKDTNIVFMLPFEAGTDSKGNRRPWILPIPTVQFAPFVIAAREAAQRALGDNPQDWSALAGIPLVGEGLVNVGKSGGVGTEGRAPVDVASGMAQNVTPISSLDVSGIAQTLTPPIVGPLGEIAADKDTFRGTRIATEARDERASWLPRNVISPLTGLRPSQSQHLWDSTMGAPGRIVNQVSDIVEGKPSANPGIQSVPVLGDAARRFVRSDIGGELDKAREGVVSAEVDSALRQAGVNYRPTPVANAIGNFPLTMAEQAEYQDITNQAVDAALKKLVANPVWGTVTPDQRDEAVRVVVANAREQARNAYSQQLSRGLGQAEIQRRLQGVK